MKELLYRVVECQLRGTATGFRVDAYLLIRGQGKSVHFDIKGAAELEGALMKVIAEAYKEITGSALPDTAH